jgi:6-phosphogluconolactonase
MRSDGHMRITLTLAALTLTTFAQAAQPPYFVYFGTYTKGMSKGVEVARFDASTGKLSKPETAVETPNPSFVAIHPNHKFLYAVGEQSEGIVSAFRIDPSTGKLTLLNSAPSRGSGPCHVNVDRSGKFVLLANYNSGSAAVYALKDDGSIGEPTGFQQHTGSGPDRRRQAGPHAHSINLSADNRFAIVADLGLDKVFVYRFDAEKGTILPNEPPYTSVMPGGGPRHFAFHPNKKFAYVINEMASKIIAFNWDAARGALTEVQSISTLPVDFKGSSSSAEVQVHPSGKFVYGSNRGDDSIAAFNVDRKTGKLTMIGNTPTEGKTPRNFGIDPTGKWMIVANQDTNNVVVFKIDTKTGKLTATGQEYQVGAPVCVKFMAAK